MTGTKKITAALLSLCLIWSSFSLTGCDQPDENTSLPDTRSSDSSEADAEESEEEEIDNGIPVVYLNIDESRGTIEDMLNSMDHSVYCYGTITIEVPEGFHYSDFPDLAAVLYLLLQLFQAGLSAERRVCRA